LFGIYSWLENIVCLILELLPPFIRHILYKLLLKNLGSDTYIDYNTYFRYSRRIVIGNNTVINRGCKFFGSYFNKSVTIEIGNNVAIAPFCCFYSAGHDYEYIYLPDTAASIIIKDNVWIGGKSIILPGVTIGEGSVIGAGSVVTKDILPWSIAVGNPAKVIKSRKIKQG
jgi:acetyltransferase-like isoleucine patch superfamily enzyme